LAKIERLITKRQRSAHAARVQRRAFQKAQKREKKQKLGQEKGGGHGKSDALKKKVETNW